RGNIPFSLKRPSRACLKSKTIELPVTACEYDRSHQSSTLHNQLTFYSFVLGMMCWSIMSRRIEVGLEADIPMYY
ncbi:unnamed protein product, partial [Urochloa humidicola]